MTPVEGAAGPRTLSMLTWRSRLRLRLSSRWEKLLPDLLEEFGSAMRVSRMYLFQNFVDGASSDLCARQRFEWTAPAIRPEIDNPELQAASYREMGCMDWIEPLRANQPVARDLATASAAQQALLNAQGIESLLVVPVFTKQQWWGFMGVDDCVASRSWRPAEIRTMQALAQQIGQLLSEREAD